MRIFKNDLKTILDYMCYPGCSHEGDKKCNHEAFERFEQAHDRLRKWLAENEWINYGKTWKEFEDAHLNNPGTQIDIDGDEMLIGEINTMGGECECCHFASIYSIVKRYRVLIKDLV